MKEVTTGGLDHIHHSSMKTTLPNPARESAIERWENEGGSVIPKPALSFDPLDAPIERVGSGLQTPLIYPMHRV
jgi:hypothetical protein